MMGLTGTRGTVICKPYQTQPRQSQSAATMQHCACRVPKSFRASMQLHLLIMREGWHGSIGLKT